MKRLIQSESGTIQYELTRKRVKNLNLRVHRDGTISVSAPPFVSEAVVDSFVLSRAEMIQKAVNHYLEERPQEINIIEDGAKVPCLGKILTIRVCCGKKNVELNGDTLIISHPNPTTEEVRKLYDKWWDRSCRELISAECLKWVAIFNEHYQIPNPTLRFRNMVSQWGNCQPRKAVVTFNKRLFYAPIECIDYIIVHELAHFIEANHSQRFHKVVSTIMPDWKERKKILENSVIPQ